MSLHMVVGIDRRSDAICEDEAVGTTSRGTSLGHPSVYRRLDNLWILAGPVIDELLRLMRHV